MINKKKLGILIEPARKYIESYPARVQEFIFEFEGYETDFIKRDLSFFQSVQQHLKDPRARDYPFFEADEALKYLGEEKMIYFLRRKIEFLVEKQKSII